MPWTWACFLTFQANAKPHVNWKPATDSTQNGPSPPLAPSAFNLLKKNHLQIKTRPLRPSYRILIVGVAAQNIIALKVWTSSLSAATSLSHRFKEDRFEGCAWGFRNQTWRFSGNCWFKTNGCVLHLRKRNSLDKIRVDIAEIECTSYM